MESKRFSLTAVFILAILIAVYLMWDYFREEPGLNVVTFCGSSGGDTDKYLIGNLTRSWIGFNAFSGPGDTVALPVAEGDIIYCEMDPAESFVYVRYRSSMGEHLAFKFDTLSRAVYLNDEPYLLFVGEGPEGAGGLPEAELERLEALSFQGNSIPDETYPLLQKIATVNEDVAVIFENGDMDKMHGIAGMFHPAWMVAPGEFLDSRDAGLSNNLQDLEILVLTGGDSLSYDVLGRLRRLRSLLLTELEAEDAEGIPLDKLKKLRSLSIIESGLQSLAGLKLPAGLKDLYLISIPGLTDIGALRETPGLRDLSLMGCDSLRDLSLIGELPALRWLSLPPGVTQESFDGVISHQQDLQGLELVKCDQITDLSSLVRLKSLESLALSIPEIDFESLKQLPAIRLLVIDESHFTDSEEEIAGLKEALPDARIVPGGGYCLGSGWLLLALPFLAVAVLYRMSLRK